AFCGLAVLAGMPYVDRLYAASVGHGLPGILLRGATCVVCLLPPTLLMGASLPAIARWLGPSLRGASRLGLLYGVNIAGAVAGCLFAGFYLLRVHDLATASYVASAASGAVGLIGLVLAARSDNPEPSPEAAGAAEASTSGSWPIYVAIALSGLCSLGAEVIW